MKLWRRYIELCAHQDAGPLVQEIEVHLNNICQIYKTVDGQRVICAAEAVYDLYATCSCVAGVRHCCGWHAATARMHRLRCARCKALLDVGELRSMAHLKTEE